MNQTTQKETLEAGKENRPRRRTAPWLLGSLVLFLLSVLVAQQAWLWLVIPPDTASDTLLLYALSSLNFAAFVVFTFIFIRSLLKLRRERRERRLGSKIKTRLVVYFITLSLLPITAMAVFSYLFLNRSLEKWFSKLPEDVVSEARKVQKEAITDQARSLRETAAMLAVMIDTQPEPELEQTLSRLIESGNLAALEIVSADGIVLTRNISTLPAKEDSELNDALERARVSNGADTSLLDNQGFDVGTAQLSGNRVLIVAPARRHDADLSQIIVGSQGEYNKLVAKQRKVRLLGLSTLGLMTLLLLFVSTWVAIYLGRGIATPIMALAEASNEVARGNLSYRVTTIADDELALLADSFNGMTAQLEENRRRIEASAGELGDKNMALEERRNYIETILESLSTGVVSLDEHNRVTTINAAAAAMLRLTNRPETNPALEEITGVEDRAMLERLLRRARRMGRATEHTELARSFSSQEGTAIQEENGAQEANDSRGANGSQEANAAMPVALTATALRRAMEGEGCGVVLVIEDLSELLTAQRAAAWSEVARRMAHEIKNPLTPIQLSAERIAKNFHRNSNHEHGNGSNGDKNIDSSGGNVARENESATMERERVARVVDECTATITREVAGLKAMVDEFSRFARLPHARLEAADLNEVVRQAVALYEDRLDGVRMDVRLARTLPDAMLDAEQLRRVFVNLIDNALEAMNDAKDEPRITIATAHDPSRALLLVEVTDNGHGIQRSDLPRLFQPSFSTRGRGTGLGLAIVQRIVSEHGGRIRAEANHPRGAKFVVELPAMNA
jgi:nitrogen fixation/metabolism regulation signal transduction histidine kinase